MELFFRLHNDVEFSFLEPVPPKAYPTYVEYMLLNKWSGSNSSTSVTAMYKKVLDACGVVSQHVVHLRSAGIERASTMGLEDRRIASMSKHVSDQFGRSYSTQLDPVVMTAMSGCYGGEPWFVPRTEVSLPCTDSDSIRHVFPQYDRWIEQFTGPMGVKEKTSASNFLYKLIPFATRVVIQDAPYWLRQYPHHEYSVFF
jgi:Centromere DNA-binding protein complex CBF3 subunit, domain 2